MKYIKLFVVSLLILTVAFGQNSLAKLVETEGQVTLKLAGDLSYSTFPEKDATINSGDAIKTGNNSYAELKFSGDASSVKIYQNSELGISEHYSSRRLSLKKGEILADIFPDITTSYSLETPNSMVVFDRAKFSANVEGQEKISVITGEMEITNLATGEKKLISDGKSAPQPKSRPDIAEVNSEAGNEITVRKSTTNSNNNDLLAYTPPQDEQTEEPKDNVTPQYAKDNSSKERNWNMGLGVGSVTIDGEIYNQVSLRPELRFGKLGVGLDLYFYFDEEGEIRREDWDDPSDYLNKLYYVRWGRQGDPFFFRAGALNYVTLGYGILMSGYSNAIEYPQVRNIGFHTGMKIDRIGWELLIADVKELSGPGLVAGRVTYDLMSKLRLGGSFVADFNQYKGLSDMDGDDIPDIFDAFPKETFRLPDYYYDGAFGFNNGEKLKGKKYNLDSDADGIPDELDYDIDGDGLTDNYDQDSTWNHDTNINRKPAPFNAEDQAKAIAAVSFDAGIPVIERELFQLDIYGQSAFFISEKLTDYYTGEKFQPGWGVAVPGFRAGFFNLVHCNLEYRFSGKNFLFNFWDRLYDIERVSVRENMNDPGRLWAYTKDELKLHHDPMKGVFGSVEFNIWNYLILNSYYQHMFSKNDEIRSFRSSLSIPPGRIPKLAEAMAFYQRNNDNNPFKFKKPSENTILGYRVGIDIGGGAILSYVYRRTYRDIDGNGTIDPDNEAVTINTIETGFRF